MTVKNLEKISNNPRHFEKSSIRQYEGSLFEWKFRTHSDCSKYQYLHLGMDYFWATNSVKRVVRVNTENLTALADLSQEISGFTPIKSKIVTKLSHQPK